MFGYVPLLAGLFLPGKPLNPLALVTCEFNSIAILLGGPKLPSDLWEDIGRLVWVLTQENPQISSSQFEVNFGSPSTKNPANYK